MPWVLTADDRLMEVEDSLALRALRLGDEVDAGIVNSPSCLPGILIGKGAPEGSQQEDLDAIPPNSRDFPDLMANVRALGDRLTRGGNFADHFDRHKRLLEGVTKKTYPREPAGEFEFLQDLGKLITSGRLAAEGIVTLKKGHPMMYAYRGRPADKELVAIVRPGGEWVTLMEGGAGLADALRYQMRFDSKFPFPFDETRGRLNKEGKIDVFFQRVFK